MFSGFCAAVGMGGIDAGVAAMTLFPGRITGGIGQLGVGGRVAAAAGPLLLDTFTGTGAITAHTPEIAPAGKEWKILFGNFDNLSGGELHPRNDSSGALAAVDVGSYQIEIESHLRMNDRTIGVGWGSAGVNPAVDFWVCEMYAAGNKVYLINRQTGAYLIQAAPSPSLVVGSVYKLTTRQYRNYIQIYLDDVYLAEKQSAPIFSGGFAGITAYGWAAGYAQDITIFDNSADWKRFTIIGDSIVEYPADRGLWVGQFAHSYNNGRTYMMNHGLGSQTIANSGVKPFRAQVAEAALDDADIVLCQLGTNDTTSVGVQAEVEYNLAILKTNQPRGTIYYMNILPKWTTQGVPWDQSAKRAAIAAGCAAQGVTCLDPSNPPVVTFADMADGTHPNATGSGKISTWLLSQII